MILATLVGCSSNSSYDSVATESVTSSSSSSMVTAESTADKSITSDDMSEKISYTVDIALETKAFDDNVEAINSAVEKYNGFVENSRIYGDVQRNAYYTVRIPTQDYIAFLQELENVGNVYNTSTKTENLTSQFVDVNARLTTLETQEVRLLELLEIAETVDDIITIEARLSEVRYEIESLTTNLRSLTLKVDYSTINIEMYEVIEYQKTDNFVDKISKTISNSFEDLIASLQNVVLFIIYVAPFLLIWALVFLFIYWIFGKYIKKIIIYIKKLKFKK